MIFKDGWKRLGLFSPRPAQAITTVFKYGKNGRTTFPSITVHGRSCKLEKQRGQTGSRSCEKSYIANDGDRKLLSNCGSFEKQQLVFSVPARLRHCCRCADCPCCHRNCSSVTYPLPSVQEEVKHLTRCVQTPLKPSNLC